MKNPESLRYCMFATNFLAPLSEGQQAVVMALCPSVVCPFVRPCVYASVCKLFLQKTSPQTIDWIFTKFHRNVR